MSSGSRILSQLISDFGKLDRGDLQLAGGLRVPLAADRLTLKSLLPTYPATYLIPIYTLHRYLPAAGITEKITAPDDTRPRKSKPSKV